MKDEPADMALFQEQSLRKYQLDGTRLSLQEVITAFGRRGGIVRFLDEPAAAPPASIILDLPASEEGRLYVYPVCTQGMYRSQVLRVVLQRMVLDCMRLPPDRVVIMDPHGATSGCDPFPPGSEQPSDLLDFVHEPFPEPNCPSSQAFGAAFCGLKRLRRAGDAVIVAETLRLNALDAAVCKRARKRLRHWFTHQYWRFPTVEGKRAAALPPNAPDPRPGVDSRAFLCFGHSTHVALARLLEANDDLSGVVVWGIGLHDTASAAPPGTAKSAFLGLYQSIMRLVEEDVDDAEVLPELLQGVIKMDEHCRQQEVQGPSVSHLSAGDDIPISLLKMYTKSLRSGGGWSKEFSIMDSTARALEKGEASAACDPDNACRNRYPDILPVEATRVKLRAGSTDYVNANYIMGPQGPHQYIAAQGPLPNTCEDFWRMVWEQRCDVVVMLTRLVEREREKCHKYWPGQFGPFLLEVKEEEEGIVIYRTLYLSNEEEPAEGRREIHHIQYNEWPDHGLPSSAAVFREVLRQSKALHREHSPILVHCSAGIGRTGTYCAVNNMTERIQGELQADPEADPSVNVFNTVVDLRRCREGMVQTKVQYKFCYKAMLEIIEDLKAGKDP